MVDLHNMNREQWIASLGRDADGVDALIVEALEQSQPLAHAYPEARERHARALAAARRLAGGEGVPNA